ncbi:MAG: exodeoxyribonuclease VII small subunit [Arsenophonus endosymbiont of Ceratovacuna japonica]
MSKKKISNKEDSLSFENLLTTLEQVVSRLESGELPLEKALTEFEYGIKLSRQGQKALQQAEQRVQILLQNNNNESLSNFTEENK